MKTLHSNWATWFMLPVILVLVVACAQQAQAPAAPPAAQPAAPQPAQPAAQPAQPVAPAQPAASGSKVSAIFDKWTTEQWMAHMNMKIIETMDSSGPEVVSAKDGDVFFYTNSSTTWGANNPKNSVWVIDAKTKKTVAVSDLPDKYALGFGSHNLGVSGDGKWAYLPALKGNTNFLLVLNARTLKIAKVLQFLSQGVSPTTGRPHHVKNFRTEDGRDLVLIEDFNWSFGGAGFYILDPSKDNALVGGMNNGDLMGGLYIANPSPDGKFIYASMPGGVGGRGGVGGDRDIHTSEFRIDPKTWTVTDNINPLEDPNWGTFTADSKYFWLTLGGPGKVVKIDTKTNQIVATVTTGPGPYGDVLSFDETKLYVADKGEAPGYNQQGRTVTVIDTEANVVLKAVGPVGRTTDHVVLSPDGKEVWAMSNADHGIWIINTETDEVVQNIKSPNDGDIHGGAFVRFFSDAGAVKSETVSGITGLLGSARAAQVKWIQTPKTTIRVSPPRPNLDQAASYRPDKISVTAGNTVVLRFVNSSGTSGGTATLQGPDGIGKFELQAGQSKVFEWKVPAAGVYTVTDPRDTQKTVLTIEVK